MTKPFSKPHVRTFLPLALALVVVACAEGVDEEPASDSAAREGDSVGECSDAADNDADGAFDCDDTDCAGSSSCDSGDTDTGATDSGDQDSGSVDDCADADGDGHQDLACGGDDCDDGDATVYPLAGDRYGDATDADCDGIDAAAVATLSAYFVAVPDGMTQPEAQAACASEGMTLASVRSDAEAEGLVRAAETLPPDWNLWIGLEYAAGVWAWQDGSIADFTDWYPRQPDFYDGSGCAHLVRSGLDPLMRWNDENCERDVNGGTYPIGYVCEIRACDADEDGYTSDGCGGDDCDDTDPAVHPRAGDTYDDGVDTDCDGIDATAVDAGTVYFVGILDQASASEAARACDAHGMTLATIRSDREADALREALLTAPFDWNWWIGLSWNGSTWVWPDGNAATYTNWYPGQPDSYDGSGCAHIIRWSYDSDMRWNDEQCGRDTNGSTYPIAYVCELR